MKTVGAFEAKTHLPKLLERVAAGETIVITRHGEPMAHLVPPPGKSPLPDVALLISRWRDARKGLSLGGKAKDLVNAGRP